MNFMYIKRKRDFSNLKYPNVNAGISYRLRLYFEIETNNIVSPHLRTATTIELN